MDEQQANQQPNQPSGDLNQQSQVPSTATAPIPEQQPPPPKKSKKKLVMILVIFALLAGGGFTYFYFQNSEQPVETETTTVEQPEVAEEEPKAAAIPELDSIFYAHADGYKKPGAIYSRPASGGDRVELYSFDNLAKIGFGFSVTANGGYVFQQSAKPWNVGKDIYYGKAENNPKLIYSYIGNKYYGLYDVVSSPNGDYVAFSDGPNIDNQSGNFKSTLWIMKNDGSNTVKAKSITKGFIVVNAVSSDGSKAVYQTRGCYQCDAPNGNAYLLDVESGKTTQVTKTDDTFALGNISVNDDFTKLIYFDRTSDSSIEVPGFTGRYMGLPEKIHVVDLSTFKDEVIKKIGKKQTQNLNKGNEYRVTLVGWAYTSDGQQPYYVDKNKVILINANGEESTMFESDQGDIYKALFVSEKEVLSSTSLIDGGETITYFNIDMNKAKTVMETADQTEILGITTQ